MPRKSESQADEPVVEVAPPPKYDIHVVHERTEPGPDGIPYLKVGFQLYRSGVDAGYVEATLPPQPGKTPEQVHDEAYLLAKGEIDAKFAAAEASPAFAPRRFVPPLER